MTTKSILGILEADIHTSIVGKNLFTLSRGKTSHSNLQDLCTKVNEILGSPEEYYGTAVDADAITVALNLYSEHDCPTSLLLQFLLSRLK